VATELRTQGKEGAHLGLVETSIGKMVPLVPAARAAEDPLLVYAEPYNTLIVDRRGFAGPVPSVPDLEPVDRIDAYVDRKLFVHNLGHAAVAYLGYRARPEVRLLADALTSDVRDRAREAMVSAARALSARYADVFTPDALLAHVDDLLGRFANRALGDTVYRVGRDLRRKLARHDRLVGAMLLCAEHGVPFEPIADAYRAALSFDAPDETGRPNPADAELVASVAQRGVGWALGEVSGLHAAGDRTVIETVLSDLVY
jgi:mannitol-1-phosphate 5-dehydrogenase